MPDVMSARVNINVLEKHQKHLRLGFSPTGLLNYSPPLSARPDTPLCRLSSPPPARNSREAPRSLPAVYCRAGLLLRAAAISIIESSPNPSLYCRCHSTEGAKSQPTRNTYMRTNTHTKPNRPEIHTHTKGRRLFGIDVGFCPTIGTHPSPACIHFLSAYPLRCLLLHHG